ncbi:Multidrug export protein AcrE [Asticcacaulis sp. MM231]|uniref:efflux RND transporter periplasmic adaptor subunit n=1 Tax=Asticcacaulis sp. MM231 TaxID=3157666 RepID=UPI0032D56912
MAPKRYPMRPFVILAVVTASMAMPLAGCSPKGQMPGAGGPVPVNVEVMTSRPVTLMTELSGRTASVLVSDVRPQVSGIIKARLFTEGALVTQGQSLYQIDPASYQAAYDSAQATLANANAALTTAKLKADRYKELVAINAISKQDNDDAQAALQQALAQVASAKASVQTANINLGYTRVTAPISGRIGKSTYTPGALVTAGQANALATIQKSDEVYVDINRSVADMLAMQAAIKAGTQGQSDSADVTLILENGTTYPLKGKLQFSDVTVDEGTGTVNLRAVFANPDGLLMPGMYVRAQLSTGVATNGILVEQAVVQRDPKGNATVFVVGPDNKVVSRPVTLGQTVGEKWLVLSGLAVGDKVVVNGLQKIAPGAAVKPSVVNAAE